MSILEVKNISKVYSTRFGGNQCTALKNISFDVEAGEFIAIMGPSGSGKTTLLNVLASLDAPSGGKVFLDGRDLGSIRDKEISSFRRHNLGFVFQDFNLLDNFSVKDNILLPLVLSRMPYGQMEKLLEPMMAQLGITPLADKFPYEISGGEKQRTAVARAMITSPKLLLADEPTGALDSRASASLMAVFSRFNAGGQTILMVTHNAESASYASRVLFIKDGELYNQLYRGGRSPRDFYRQIIGTMAVISGGEADA